MINKDYIGCSMSSPEILEEFQLEADEMLNESEEILLALEKGEDFHKNFNSIFRVFHSLKGAAGMFQIDELQAFMHDIETQFESLRDVGSITKNQIDYFLRAVDSARQILDGKIITFDTSLFNEKVEIITSPKEIEKQIETVVKRSEEKAAKKKGYVIVVDDEEFICEHLCQILNNFGYTTRGFTNPVEAVAAIIKEEPDLICTDLKMPEMTGMQLLKEIRKAKVESPLIFITGFIDNKLLTEGLESGASGFLEKPFEEHQVVSLSMQSVERYRTKRLLTRSINYMLYQFSDLDTYLKESGKETLRRNLKQELESILTLKREFN